MKLFYKISSAVLALCVVPILLFAPYLHMKVSSQLLKEPIEQTISMQTFSKGLNFASSNAELNTLLKGINYKEAWAALGNLRIALVISAAALGIAVLFALAVAVAALFSKKKLLPALLSGGGILSMLTAIISFSFFAGPILDGSFDVMNLLGKSADTLKKVTDLLGSLTGSLLDVSVLKFGNAITLLFMLFVVLLIWIALFYVLDIFLEGGRPERKKKQLSPAQRAEKKEKELKKQQAAAQKAKK